LPLLGSVYWGPLNNWLPWLAVFGLISPPTGSVTINLSFASTGPNVSSYAQSVSYSNVASFGSLTTAANTSFANLHTMTSLIAPGNLAFNTFATNAGSVANITSYNQTTRQNIIFGYQNNSGLILGDAPGGNAPVNFSATTSNNSTAYGGAVLPIFHA